MIFFKWKISKSCLHRVLIIQLTVKVSPNNTHGSASIHSGIICREASQAGCIPKGAFVSAGGSWNLIAFTDLRVCLGEFIDRDYGPVNPAWEVGS